VSWWGKWRERDRWGDIGLDGCIRLGWICGETRCIGTWWGNWVRKRPLGRPRRRWVNNIRMGLWAEGAKGSWSVNRRERDNWADLDVNVWIICGWICGKSLVYRVFVGKPEGQRPLGRPRRRWLYNNSLVPWGAGGKEGKNPLFRPRRSWVDNIRMDLWGEGVYSFLVRLSDIMRPLGRSKRSWEDNIRMDLWVRGDYSFLVGETVGK